jgi:hypothetical protein
VTTAKNGDTCGWSPGRWQRRHGSGALSSVP